MTQQTQKPSLGQSLGPIARIARPEWMRYALALAAMVAATAAAYVGPLVPQVAIDGVFASSDADASRLVERSVAWLGGAETLRARPWIFAILAIGVASVSGLFAYLRARLTATAAEATTQRLRNTLFDRLVRARVPALGEHETGDLVQRCTADVATVHTFLSSQLVEVGRAAFMFVVPLPLMLLMDPWMTLAAVSLIPALIFISVRFLGKIRSSFQKMDEADGRMTSTIQENLAGSRVVRAFGQQAREKEKLAQRNATHRDLDLEVYRHAAGFWGASDALCVAQLSLVFAIGLGRIQSGMLTPGELFFFMSAVGMYIFPLRMMGRILSEFGKTTVAAQRLGVVLGMPAEAAGTKTLEPAHARGACVRAKGLRFRYGDELPWVLDGVDFELEPGQVLGLLGPSGAGKSTLVDLLLGIYPIESGTLSIDGVPVQEIELDALRAAVDVVPQQPILFSRSIRDNIAMGNPEATDEEIEAAAKAACIHESILGFPKGYETVVGERGVMLSGGQRQRVAIARALVGKARLLILDDSLSAVDTRTERAILDALKSTHNKTSIVIAHRLSAIMHADLVLALEDGTVVERGDHETLINAGGHYAQTWAQQSGEAGDAQQSRVTVLDSEEAI